MSNKKGERFISLKRLTRYVNEGRFPNLHLPTNNSFKGCKYLGIKILQLDTISENGLERNIIRTFDDLDSRSHGISESFDAEIRTDKPLPTVVKYPGDDRLILNNGFGRFYTFNKHGQEFYAFYVVEITDEKYYANLAAWANESCYEVTNTIPDRVNNIVNMIRNKKLKNTEKAIRRYIKNVYQTICKDTTEKVVEEVKQMMDTGTEPELWRILDKSGSVHKEWVQKFSMIQYPDIDKEVIDDPVLGKGNRVLKQIVSGYCDKIATAIRKKKNKNLKTHFVLHTPAPKSEIDLLKKRVSLLKEISSWWNDMSGYFKAPNRRRPFELMGFLPQNFKSNHFTAKKHYVSIKKVLRDANDAGIDTRGIIF